MKRIAEALGVSRSNLAQRSRAPGKPRGPYRKAGDEELSPLIRRLVDERPSTGYRRIAALLNRESARQGHPIANRKRIYRIMSRDRLLLEQASGRRSGRLHDGEVMVEASDIRCVPTLWSSPAGTERWSAWPSSSTPSTVKSSPSPPSSAQGSARFGHSRSHAGGRRTALWGRQGAQARRASLRQWRPLHGQGKP